MSYSKKKQVMLQYQITTINKSCNTTIYNITTINRRICLRDFKIIDKVIICMSNILDFMNSLSPSIISKTTYMRNLQIKKFTSNASMSKYFKVHEKKHVNREKERVENKQNFQKASLVGVRYDLRLIAKTQNSIVTKTPKNSIKRKNMLRMFACLVLPFLSDFRVLSI